MTAWQTAEMYRSSRILKRSLALFLLAALPVAAQVPRAEVVDPSLQADAGNDFFNRGRNIYAEAQKATDLENRQFLYRRAAEIFADYLNAFPDHPNAEMAWWLLGNSYYQAGEIEEGKRCFSILLNRYGKGQFAANAAYTLAADHYNQGQYAMAAPLFERFAQNAARPEDRPKGNYYAGNCYRFQGQDRQAILAYREVVGDAAGGLYIGQAKVALGSLALKAGKDQEALTLFQEVLDAPYTPRVRGEAAVQGALAAMKLGQDELADRYLQIVMSGDGMETYRPDAQIALMQNHFDKGQYREAVDLFRRSDLKAAGEKEAARLMIAGRAYMRLKQPREALGLFREVERSLKPEHDLAFQAAYYRLLCFFQIEGRHVTEQVDAFLQIYAKARPKDERIHTAMMMKAETLFSQKKITEAARVYQEIDAGLVSESNRPGLLYQRGWCLSDAGDTQGSIRSLSEFITKYPADERVPVALAKRAKAYADNAESAKALADFDKLATEKTASAELKSFAWLESARLRRTEKNIEDMVVRYQGLLAHAEGLKKDHEAEANYWIGWGMVKTNAAKEAVPFLEKARTLQPDAYRKHAGLLLALSYFAAQDPEKLTAEIQLAIEGDYASDIPDQAIQWAGMQAYNARRFQDAAKFLDLVSNPAEPRETPKEVWRYLAKASLEAGDAEKALVAASNVIEVEENPAWKADGLLDRGRALFLLKRPDEARQMADQAFDLRPQGRTSAGLRILSGDLFLHAGDPKLAAADYLNVVQFHEDRDLKPLALHQLTLAFEAQNDAAQAGKYREQLKSEFPDWKAPSP